MATLLIKQDDISKNTPIGGNVQTARLLPAIKAAQLNNIKPLLEYDLYNKIVTEFSDDTLANQYLELYEDYIAPMIIHLSASIYFGYGAYSISDAGIFKSITKDAEGINKDEVDYLVKAQYATYKDYKREFYSFINTNSPLFPEWTKKEPKIQKHGGWLLGTSKGRNGKSTNGSFPTVEWGNINGTLANQIDLTSAIDLKANALDISLVGFSGEYSDLLNIPPITTDWGEIGGTLTTQTDLIDALNLKANALDVSLVGFSGEYNDLLNKPTIASDWGLIGGTLSNQTDLIDALNLKANAASLSNVATSGEYSDLLNTPIFKTINTESLIGPGDIVIPVDFKTINNLSILGTGNIQLNSAALLKANNLSDLQDLAAAQAILEFDKKVSTDTNNEPPGSDKVVNMVSLTQAEYDAGTPVATTFYIIKD